MDFIDKEVKSYIGENFCPKCKKSYVYFGDVPEGGFLKGQEPYCVCNQPKNCYPGDFTPTDYQIGKNHTIPSSNPFQQIGWECPVCGRGVNPNLSSCPCQTEPNGMSA